MEPQVRLVQLVADFDSCPAACSEWPAEPVASHALVVAGIEQGIELLVVFAEESLFVPSNWIDFVLLLEDPVVKLVVPSPAGEVVSVALEVAVRAGLA